MDPWWRDSGRSRHELCIGIVNIDEARGQTFLLDSPCWGVPVGFGSPTMQGLSWVE